MVISRSNFFQKKQYEMTLPLLDNQQLN
jgi:hypothetical protein